MVSTRGSDNILVESNEQIQAVWSNNMADETSNATRGSLGFQVDDSGNLLNLAANVNLLRRLWFERTLIGGEDLGPGDPGDFDFGAWHSSCHLLGAGGVCQTADGQLLWLEVGHAGVRDEYVATLTIRENTGIKTCFLDSAEGRSILAGAIVRGFVEGNSLGRVSARICTDLPDLFNLWRRQDFDQPVTSELEGGKVWEHWCTLRDLRSSNRIGLTAIAAYVSLVSTLGDQFAPAVLRGRRDYGHPVQLAAMVHAGFIASSSATMDLNPKGIPINTESYFLEACPKQSLVGAENLTWPDKGIAYYMFRRKIKSWSKSNQVKEDIKQFSKSLD